MERERIRVHVLVLGRVQGVGYRAWTQKTAQKRGICGWVRNLPGGEVEAILEGPALRVHEFLEEMSKGPLLARVSEKKITYQKEMQNLEDFVVIR